METATLGERYRVEEVPVHMNGRRLVQVLDARRVRAPGVGRRQERLPVGALRCYSVRSMGRVWFLRREPDGEVRTLDPARGCSCPQGLMGSPCVHLVIVERLCGCGPGLE